MSDVDAVLIYKISLKKRQLKGQTPFVWQKEDLLSFAHLAFHLAVELSYSVVAPASFFTDIRTSVSKPPYGLRDQQLSRHLSGFKSRLETAEPFVLRD